MIYFLSGEDVARVNERRRELMDGFRKKYPTGEIQLFDFEDAGTPDAIVRACVACDPGLFATQKLVLWLHPEAAREGEDVLKACVTQLAQSAPQDISLLVVAPGKIKKTHPVTSILLKRADRVEALSPLVGVELERYALASLARFDPGLSIGRPALTFLLKTIGHDTLRLQQEIAKLAAYRGTGMITSEDVTLFLRPSQETTVFQALDALSRGERERALLLFAHEQSGSAPGDAVYGLLSMCAWQIRRLIQIREAYDQGVKESAQIAKRTKLPPFAVQGALRSMQHLSLARLLAALALLADMDAALKVGEMDPGVALDTFVWKF